MTELIVVKQLPEIEEHLRAFKAQVDEKVSEALSIPCTEETLQTVKKSRAELNAVFKDLEAKRIAVKKQILAPYDAFEAIYKECVSDAFKKGDIELKSNIERVENSLKDEKLAAVTEYFNELCEAEGVDYLTFDDLDIKITLSVSDKKLKESAKERVLKIKSDVEMIRTQEHADEIMVEYRKGYDVSQAILLVNDRHKRMEEERQRAAADAERREREAAAEQKVAEVAQDDDALSAPEEIKEETEVEEVYTVSFRVVATADQIRELKKFLEEKGIRYE